MVNSDRIKIVDELIKKIPSHTAGEKATILLDESILIKENARNPVFQIFRNFLFWAETGFRISLQKSPLIIVPAKVARSISLTPFTEGIKREILIRSIWESKPDMIPISSTSVKTPRVRKPARNPKRLAQLFLMHTWLLLKSAFYIQPRAAIRQFSLANLKEFIKKELFSPGEPAHKKALSVAIGIFCGIIPLWGWQTIIAITLSISLRLNKIITITASSISITPLFPLILYLSYLTGGFFMGSDITFQEGREIDMEFIKVNFLQYFIGAFIFALAAGLITGLLTWSILLAAPRKGEQG
jgi:uncharacterized protein (DUF2062 family)